MQIHAYTPELQPTIRMAPIYPWQPDESCDLVIQHLVEGRCVALPTEATYEIVASALCPDALAKLGTVASEQSPAVVLGDYANLHDWLPLLRGSGPRLFRRLGAGPITLLAPGFTTGLWQRLPDESRALIVQDRQIAVRWPAHVIWDELRRANLPLVSIPVEAGNSAAETSRLAGDLVACVIDGGPTEFGVVPSLVQAVGRRCRMLRDGVLSRDQIEELALCRIVFICTGNTCRSPMAEVLCAKLLADNLGCEPRELKQHGFNVQSAGLAAMPGGEASRDAVSVVADLGADLSRHRSRPATMEMLVWADYIFTMTASHAYALTDVPQISAPRLLSPQGEDVADPIGGALADYRCCAEQIIQYLKERLPELLES